MTKKGEIVYSLPKYEKEAFANHDKESAPYKRHMHEEARHEKPRSVKGIVLREELQKGFKPDVAGGEKAETIVNYFKGNDPKQWYTNIPTYNSISLGEIYPGVKLELKAYGNNVEKIFRVEPGIDLSVIQMKLRGARGMQVDEGGELKIETDLSPASFTAPVAYQYIEGKKVEVQASYAVKDTDLLKGEQCLVYGFQVGAYDPTKELIIDPLLASTYLGGSDGDSGNSVAIDSRGNLYVTGNTWSSDFPTTTGAYDAFYNDNGDVFVVKLDSSLSRLQAFTYLGGSSTDLGFAIVLDSSGNVYVRGWTSSSDFPTTIGAYDTSYNGGYTAYDNGDIFIAKLDSSLSRLQASTYLGGSHLEEVGGVIALDSSGNVYVAGHTESSNFPTTIGAYDTSYNGGYTEYDSGDIFIAKLDSSLSRLQASTYLGGSSTDRGAVIALDSRDNVYLTGWTSSRDFPTTGGAYDTSYNGDYFDVFVAKLDSSLSHLQASTYLGGSSTDLGNAIALDSSGNVYVTGETFSSDFPTTSGVYDNSHNGYFDIFIAKLDSSLSRLQASTYLGGSDSDAVYAIALDSSGNVYVTGLTSSGDFPTTSGAYDTSYNGGSTVYDYGDVFVAKVDSSLSRLQASTYLGGSNDDWGTAMALDNSSNVYLTGWTSSSDFPTTSGVYDTSYNGGYTAYDYGDVFVVNLDSNLSAQESGDENEVTMLELSKSKLIHNYGESEDITVTVSGDGGHKLKGKTVTTSINRAGKKRVSISPETTVTDADGNAVFTITAKNKKGNAKIKFKVGGLKETLNVKIK